MRRSTRWIIAVTAVAVLSAAAVVAARSWEKRLTTTASIGKTRAEAGARSLAALDTTAAASEFAAASHSFASAKRSLGPEWMAGAVGAIPWAGRQYSTARTLVEIGLDTSVAGAKLAEALTRRPTGPAARADGRLAPALLDSRADVEAALTSLFNAADRANALKADGLVPPLAKQVRSIQDRLHKVARILERGRAILQLEQYLLAENRRILIISQDGAELRPTGGFAGSYGIISIGPDGERAEAYQDVYNLPDPPGRVRPPRGGRMTGDYGFRDANWWIDFPTSAREMLGFWRSYRMHPVDAIVAIDTVALEDLLSAIGPVNVPSYKETFTSENVLHRLLYLVQVKKRAQSDRKLVLVALGEQLQTQVLRASGSTLTAAALAVAKSADAKHVQIYFTHPGAQAAVEALGWSGRVAPPHGATDVIAVSNAMNLPGKVNTAMEKTIDYEVMLRPDCTADTTLSLHYSNTGPYPLAMPSVFRDWLRVYRRPGTVFQGTDSSGRPTETLTEFGFPAEAREFTLHRGDGCTEVLVAKVPGALQTDSAQGGSGSTAHYQLYVVKQADLKDAPTTITVIAPPGWRVIGANARLIASGMEKRVTWKDDRAHLTFPLAGDLLFDVRLAAQQ